MKRKAILLFMLFVSIVANAQTYKFNSTEFSTRIKKSNGNWTEWTDWEDSSVLIVMSLDRSKINIYSEKVQEYDIYDFGNDTETDKEGGSTWTLRCVNEDGLRCAVRLRKQSNGILQLYVDFRDMSWVYNIKERN